MTSGLTMSRRAVMAGLGGAAISPAFGTPLPALTIASPAPPATPLHTLNLQLVKLLGGVVTVDMPAVALPQSINLAARLPSAERVRHWPIVTTPDFAAARAGAGPEWHGYPRAYRNLKFVSALYEVGFGIQSLVPDVTRPGDLAGKRIGVPARPSAVRWLSEALLRDGWGLLDRVELVELPPSGIGTARQAGAIDATAWNLVLPASGGLAPMLPLSNARFIDIDEATIGRINAGNPFQLATVTHDQRRLISFRQGLAAWEDTSPLLIGAVLGALQDHAGGFTGFPRSVAEMKAWPALTDDDVHPAAQAFLKKVDQSEGKPRASRSSQHPRP